MSEEELLRKEIADLHAEIIALRRTIEKLQVEANFELFDLVMENGFSLEYEKLLVEFASEQGFSFIGREYEPKRYVIKSSLKQAERCKKEFSWIYRVRRTDETMDDVYLCE